MTENELIEAICKKSNEFAIMTGLHAANVAYVPEKWKPLYPNQFWKIINGNYVLINTITVFFKPVNLIFVNYMENPSDEMRNIPVASEATKLRSFIKIGRIRLDTADIVSYNTQGTEELYVTLRYNNDRKCIRETPAIIRQAVIDLDKYFNIQTIL